MKKKLRIGLIGTGIAARKLYLPGLAESRRVRLVACTNRSLDKAKAFAKLAGEPRVFEDAEALIASPDVDAVFISLPIAVQLHWVKKALTAGKPVMSEKPIAVSVAAGSEAIEAAATSPVPWLVGENYEFMDHVHRFAKWVARGRLGALRIVEARQMTLMNEDNPYFATAWRATPEHLAGFISDGGVHLARALRVCLGEPRVLGSVTAAFNAKLMPFDTVTALLRFESGALGTWTSCFSAPYAGPMLTAYGEKGRAELWYNRAELITHAGKVSRFKSKKNSFAEQFDHFSDVVLRGVESRATPQAALLDLRLIDELCASIER
jgi:predicted dehydrogenase